MVSWVRPAVDTVLEVDTPEHLAFKARVAGPVRRAAAWGIDLLVRGAILFALVMSSLAASAQAEDLGLDLSGLSTGLMLLGLFVLNWFYFVGFEMVTGGRSPGKMALNLRVVKDQGLTISWRESVLRNLARAGDLLLVDTAVLPLGLVVMGCDRRFRRLGDLVAGTMVVVEPSTRIPQIEVPAPDPELVRSLPRSLPLNADELEAIDLFVRRRRLAPTRREELARILAPELAERLGLPPPAQATPFLVAVWTRAQDPGRSLTR